MAHRVTFQAPPRELGKADVKFIVQNEEGVIGTLKVSNGSLVWFPSGTTNGYKIGWAAFNRLMKENVNQIETR